MAGLVLACLMLVACLPVILGGSLRGRAADDSINYHEKAIRQFAQELPNPNLKDYLSATTPGYHLALAVAGRSAAGIGSDGRSAYDINLTPAAPDARLSSERRVLQFAGLGFTLIMLYTVGRWSQGRLTANPHEQGPVLVATAVALPLVGSPYIYQSAAWLLPDNSAWVGVLAILLIALRPRLSFAAIALMGLLLVWLVTARQIHAWAAGLVWAGAWLSASVPTEREQAGAPLLALSDLMNRASSRAISTRLAWAVLCTAPAALVLGGFWLLWDHQLVPPSFVAWHGSSFQTATPAFILGLVALLSPFFASWLWPGLKCAWRDHRAALAIAAACGLLLAVVPPTGWDFEHGRFGGVWTIYKFAGTIGGRSLALTALAPMGAAIVAAALAGVGVRERWTMLAALAGFALANCANPQLWQRYHEPFVLLWLIIASVLVTSRISSPDAAGARRMWKLGGPVALALLLGATNLAATLHSESTVDKGFRPGHIADRVAPAQSERPS